jgi:addiction module RelE/StbE family toxin
VKLKWSPEAEADLGAVHDYIAAESSSTAGRIELSIYDAASSLLLFPNRGRSGRWEGTRELVLTSLPYLIIYQIRSDDLYIIRILHGKQLWPPADGG